MSAWGDFIGSSPARPDGSQGRDLHPGLVSMPGSISVFAALPQPLLRSTARETLPQPRLPGDFIANPGRDFHNGFLPVVSARQTPRCSTRGLFFKEGRVIRARNLFANESPVLGGLNDCARDSAEGLPCVVGLHPERMEQTHGTNTEDDYGKNHRRTDRV